MSSTIINFKTSDRLHVPVDARLLRSSKIIQDMINAVGLSEVTTKPLCLGNINANTLAKIVHWNEYHLKHSVPDN
jgi:hypothetical protein